MNQELPVLLARQISAFFIMILMGWAAFKCRIVTSEDAKVLTRILLYVVTPAVILMSYQTEAASDTSQGLLIAFIAAAATHGLFILAAKALGGFLKLSATEKCSLIYTNSGNLVIPLVMSVLGPRAVMYATAYLAVQTVLIWTHCLVLISGSGGKPTLKKLLNINNFAIVAGVLLYFLEIRISGPLETALRGAGATIGPLAMFSIGIMLGSSRLSEIPKPRNIMISLMRLIAFPLLATLVFFLAQTLVMPQTDRMVLLTVLLSASAPSAVLVSQFALMAGGDHHGAAAVNIITDFLCILTIPAMIWLFLRLTS